MNFLKRPFILVLFFVFGLSKPRWGAAQQNRYVYTVCDSVPFGKPNLEMPSQIEDYAKMIGICDCKSTTRNKDKTWAAPVDMQWTFKYIMNGTAIQDETLKSDGTHSGSIRQFNKDSLRWFVHYYSSQNAAPVLAAWEGGKKDDEIVLYRRQKAPNGMDGFYKIRFYDISEEGFKWLGVWTTLKEDFVYATWKIECIKRSGS